MSVIFESIINIDSNGQWFIELTDTMDGRVAICHDLDTYSQKVEDFGSDYGGHIDEVRWSKSENVPPYIIDEIRVEMAVHQAEIEKKKGESLNA
ncbi:MAG: hypothetical protein PHU40_09545 [Sulfurimonas sp.]|nr:hypothetical protein [Sulfurimonas sp.]